MSRISDLAGFTTALSTTQDLSVGVITATSFSGDGSGLTGVASTDNIQTATEANFLSGVKITGVTTASGGITVPNNQPVTIGDITIENRTSPATGSLIETSDDLLIKSSRLLVNNANNNENMIVATQDAAVDLYYNNTKRLETADGGVVVTGVLTATTGRFSGNVSIGGTLTYQDVEHIDSVGIITAQQGIQVLANGANITGIVTVGVTTIKSGEIEVVGVLTATTIKAGSAISITDGAVSATRFHGDGTNLTGIDVSPSIAATAVGSISDGQALIIQNDGSVTGIATTANSEAVHGTATSVNTSYNNWYASTVDTDENKIILAGTNSSNEGVAVVGSIDPTTKAITYGSVTTFTTSNVNDSNWQGAFGAAYDTNSGKVIITYKDQSNSNYGYYVVGEVSGTSITFGSPAALNSVATSSTGCAVYPDGTVIAVYSNYGSDKGNMRAGTISGTTISWGTQAEFSENEARYNSIIYNADLGKMVNFYQDGSGGGDTTGYAVVINRSGTTLTSNTRERFASGETQNIYATYDSDNKKMVVIFTDADDSDKGKFVVGEKKTGGTELQFGSEDGFTASNANYHHDLAYDSNSKRVIIVWLRENQSKRVYIAPGQTLGSGVNCTMTFPDGIDVEPTGSPNGGNYSTRCEYDPNSKRFVYSYRTSNTTYLRTFYPKFFHTTLTTGNFIGFSNGAYTNGQQATVQIVGAVDDAQSGLTIGRKQFLQADGSLGITTDARFTGAAFNGQPIVEAGTSISSTKIIIKG